VVVVSSLFWVVVAQGAWAFSPLLAVCLPPLHHLSTSDWVYLDGVRALDRLLQVDAASGQACLQVRVDMSYRGRDMGLQGGLR
jgi:hypothetical protein